MLSTCSGCKEQIPNGRPAEHSKAGGGGWEEDNKATGEGHKAVEMVSGIAEWWAKRHERADVRRVGTEEEAGEEKPRCPWPPAGQE